MPAVPLHYLSGLTAPFARPTGTVVAGVFKLSIARSGGTLKKVLESYKKKDLLILDEWLIRPLSPQESY